jgi:hypothetical protein
MSNDHDMNEFLLEYATLFRHFDTDASLFAIHGLTKLIETWRCQLDDDIEATRMGEYIDPDLGHESVYREVAITHAAVGCLAPFIEGVLAHGIQHLRNDFLLPDALRKQAQWNIRRNGIVDGFLNLVLALNIRHIFPDNCEKILRALFCYRNVAFHNGFEWPVSERQKFKARSVEKSWDGYIDWSVSGGEFWIATLSPTFVNECALLCSAFVKSFEAVRITWTKNGWMKNVDS